MDLYNLLLGDGKQGARGATCIAALGIEPKQLGRFRDAWTEVGPDNLVRIAIYTRNGGANREAYAEEISAMQANDYYIADVDDDFDSTYATFYFRMPGEDIEIEAEGAERWPSVRADMIESAHTQPLNLSEIWRAKLEAIKSDPRFALTEE